MQVERVHVRPRVELFIPLRVSGAPSAKSILSARITIGKFVDSNNPKDIFVLADSWTCRGTAHKALQKPWIGRTIFIKKFIDAYDDAHLGECIEDGLNSHPAFVGSHASTAMSREESQFLSPSVGRAEDLYSPMYHDSNVASACVRCYHKHL